MIEYNNKLNEKYNLEGVEISVIIRYNNENYMVDGEFTDYDELMKWKKDPNQQTFVFTFEDYAEMLLKKNAQGEISPAIGFVINPFSNSVLVTRKMAAQFMAAKLAKQGILVPKPAAAQPADAVDSGDSAEE